jgi:hypothetical protein
MEFFQIKLIQIMLVIFTIISFKVLQVDVKTTFLNGDLSNKINSNYACNIYNYFF